MSVYYVYILETTSKKGKKTFYTGYTKDLYERLKKHQRGTGAKYCRGKENIVLKYFEIHLNRDEAMKRELKIKSFSKNEKLKLINSFVNRANDS